jgi:hypothetical protein
LEPFGDFDKELILLALRRSGPFWFDDLGPLLAKARWSKLKAECGIEKTNYGTVRVLEGSPFAERKIVGHLQGPILGNNEHQIAVETLRPEVTVRYRDFGLDFYPPEVLGSSFLGIINSAIRLISNVRGAAVAVSSVLSVMHILRPEFPEYDVSYSEPSTPFSIFVGVSRDDQPNRNLRIAEGILHECMHLQLTLLEDHVQFVAVDDGFHLSPWRQTLRPTRGVLHALYVFRVIQDFLYAVLVSKNLTETERNYVTHRLNDINTEVEQMGNLSASADLTPAGKALAARLQKGNSISV